MILHPPIMALVLASLISAGTLVWAAGFAVQLLRNWQPSSGRSLQINMEKRTYLVSTALAFVLVLELASLLLFVANADQMAVLFVGAMCAAGTLNVNEFGMPALMLKLAVFFVALVWLLINQIDNKAKDYPFTKFKYSLLIVLAPLVVAAAVVQITYFINLETDTITSCCARAFVPEGEGVAADLASLPPMLALWLLFGGLGVMLLLALLSLKFRAAQVAYGVGSAVFFVISIAAVVSVISSYIYEQPHHHCPFDVIKPEYFYIGYWLYIPLFSATGFGMAAGVLALHPKPESLADSFAAMLKKRILVSAALFVMFGLVALFAIWNSNLILFG